MRIARFAVSDEVKYGIVDGGSVNGDASSRDTVGGAAGGDTASPGGNGTGQALRPDLGELTIAEIAGHPFGPGPGEPRLTGVCWPRCCRARSSPSAGTTLSMRAIRVPRRPPSH